MAETSSAAASTSTTANSNNSYDFDVFLNHRGPDTKKTFASHLYRSLRAHGIKAFLDQSELQAGDYLTPQIKGAIRSASVQVAIFSGGYADSAWCLNELVLMGESNSPIIPVFYGVKPTDLRRTRDNANGVYAEALKKLEDKQRYDSDTIESWRNALSNAAGISGLELEACNGDEGELLDRVVQQVLKKAKKVPLDVAKYPTGLDDKLNDFKNTVLLPLQQSRKPQIMGIVGLGGVGKSTLAKEFFNRKNSDYRRSCFLSDVRDYADKGSLNLLQRELVKRLTGSDKQIVNVDEGIGILKNHISSPNILVILDDVDKVDQVYALFPDPTVLHSDSLILITSRRKDVLKKSRVEESSIYNLSGLTAQRSLELFCLHSFNQPHPLPEFKSLVEKFLTACGGLPLSLKVFGALLNGENTSYWEEQLDKLQRILPKEIKQRLQISYDALDAEEQQIFLDIACFFIGEDRDTAITIWDSGGLCGFQNLQNKSLVEVDRAKKIRMHDHLRDMGREIAKDPKLPRRLWRWTENDIEDLLQSSSVIPVRGMTMVHSVCNDIDDDDVFGRMRSLQILDTEGDLLKRILRKVQSPNLKWLRWNKCPYSSLPSWISMKNLRVLHVPGSKLETLWKQESQAPLQLRELKISSDSFSGIPKSIRKLNLLKRFEITPFRDKWVPLTKLPEEFCLLQSLKALVLQGCSLESLPECFGDLINLQHIDLSWCTKLERLPSSFGDLINLQYLKLRTCSKLTMSSKTLGKIRTLECIDLSDCKKNKVFPPQVAHQRSLEQLLLEGTNIKELPDAIGELSELEVLRVGSPLLDTLPASLGDLRNLKKLDIFFCTALKCLPASIGQLTQLTKLKVWDCPLITELPFIKGVKGERDTLGKRSAIDNGILPRLQMLYVCGTGISEVSFAEGVCFNLRRLWIWECPNLKSIRGLGQLTKLEVLNVSWCSELEEVEGIQDCMSLRLLRARHCPKLQGVVEQLRSRSVDCFIESFMVGLQGYNYTW